MSVWYGQNFSVEFSFEAGANIVVVRSLGFNLCLFSPPEFYFHAVTMQLMGVSDHVVHFLPFLENTAV